MSWDLPKAGPRARELLSATALRAANARSRRVMEKAGLSFLRDFAGDWPTAIEGSEHGEVEYQLTRNEWEQHL